MKKRTVAFVSFLAAFVLAGIGFSLLAVAGPTRITPSGIQFPDTTAQNTAWISSANDIFYTNGNVGIGAVPPETPLHVRGYGGSNVVTIEKGPLGLVMQALDGFFSFIGWGSSGYNALAIRAQAQPEGIYLLTNGNVGIGTSTPSAKLHVNGELIVEGSMSFPPPAYNSGWQGVQPGWDKTFTHNIGGNVDDYVVVLDFQQDGGFRRHNLAIGGTQFPNCEEGAYYSGLTATQVHVYRCQSDPYCDVVRVRIWKYK